MKAKYPNETCYCFASETFCDSLRSLGLDVENLVSTPFLINIKKIKPHQLQTPPYDFNREKLCALVTPKDKVKRIFVDVHFSMKFVDYALIHQYFLKEDCDVFINGLDRLGPVSKDLMILAPSSFITSIIEWTGKEPILYGKPGEMIGEYAVGEFQIKNRKRCLFVGDNLQADIEFAIRLGFQSLLVLSGAHTKEHMHLQSEEYQPDYYTDSLGDFVQFFNEMC